MSFVKDVCVWRKEGTWRSVTAASGFDKMQTLKVTFTNLRSICGVDGMD